MGQYHTIKFLLYLCAKKFIELRMLFLINFYIFIVGKAGKEALFPCSSCDRMFDQMSKLKMHNRVHTGMYGHLWVLVRTYGYIWVRVYTLK